MARDRPRTRARLGRPRLNSPAARGCAIAGLGALAVTIACVTGGCAASPRFDRTDGPRVGAASYYGPEFSGHTTASGERYDPRRLTAAHRTLPFGTRVRVTNLANGRRVVVRINDRGPRRADRIIDLSRHAARRLGLLDAGVARVRLDVLD